MKIYAHNRKDLEPFYNKKVWICHINWENRIIKPVEAVMKKNTRCNYGEKYVTFHELKKNGEPYAKAISQFNQGSSRISTSVDIFDNGPECISYFIQKCENKIKFYNNLKKEVYES